MTDFHYRQVLTLPSLCFLPDSLECLAALLPSTRGVVLADCGLTLGFPDVACNFRYHLIYSEIIEKDGKGRLLLQALSIINAIVVRASR